MGHTAWLVCHWVSRLVHRVACGTNGRFMFVRMILWRFRNEIIISYNIEIQKHEHPGGINYDFCLLNHKYSSPFRLGGCRPPDPLLVPIFPSPPAPPSPQPLPPSWILGKFLKFSLKFLKFPLKFLKFPLKFLKFPLKFLKFPLKFLKFPLKFLKFPPKFPQEYKCKFQRHAMQIARWIFPSRIRAKTLKVPSTWCIYIYIYNKQEKKQQTQIYIHRYIYIYIYITNKKIKTNSQISLSLSIYIYIYIYIYLQARA